MVVIRVTMYLFLSCDCTRASAQCFWSAQPPLLFTLQVAGCECSLLRLGCTAEPGRGKRISEAACPIPIWASTAAGQERGGATGAKCPAGTAAGKKASPVRAVASKLRDSRACWTALDLFPCKPRCARFVNSYQVC